jgi:hypothetical protein
MLYQERGTDSISNLYTIKIINKTLQDLPLRLQLENAPGRIIEAEGKAIDVKKEGQGLGSFFIVLPKSFVTKRKLDLMVGLYQNNQRISTAGTTFMGAFSKF